MDYNKYMNASFTEQMQMMFDSIKEQEGRLKPEDYLTASPIDQIRILINSAEKEQKKIDSGYYLTAPWTERVAFMARQIKAQIEEETNLKISDIEFYLNILKDNKKYVILLLDKIDKSDPNVGNLEEVNDLLDRLIFLLKEEHKKQTELTKLK